MLDVHPPHKAAHGVRDFAIHLFTITIGLLIALSLEGAVEWQHHRHLVHDAEASLHEEIQSNAESMPGTLDALKKEQASLKHDVELLKVVMATKKFPPNSSLSISFGIKTFEDVSWKTAQSTGALSYMPYDMAQKYSNIYATQNELADSEKAAARDTIIALGPFLNTDKNDLNPHFEEASAMKDKIEVLQGQLLLVSSFMNNLDADYKDFLKAHP